MSNLVDFAEQELSYLTPAKEDGPDKWMHDHIITMVKAFSEEGHSGNHE